MGDLTLGDRELDVMAALWDRGSGTVAEVREALPDALAYTTVLTILRNLEEKGYLRREAEGRAHRYFPRVGRAAAQRSFVGRVVDQLFGGRPADLVAHLVEEDALSATELQRLQRLLNASGRPKARGRS
jgi:BlaI family transcriptional regulator, penicillinase repressor